MPEFGDTRRPMSVACGGGRTRLAVTKENPSNTPTAGHHLPSDRQTSSTVTASALNQWAIQPATGVPEPLQLALNDGVLMMLVPTAGFGWVIGDHEVTPKGTNECILSITAETHAEVDKVISRAGEAGRATRARRHTGGRP